MAETDLETQTKPQDGKSPEPASPEKKDERANRQKATELRNEAAHCRELAERKRLKVLEKERESQRMHQEAVRVEHHADKLKRDRARSLEVIARRREARIDEHRRELRRLKGIIESKRAEAKSKQSEAATCRAQADSAAIRGTTNRSLGQPHGDLLQQAETRIYEARALEHDAETLGREWHELGRMIDRECNEMVEVGRKREAIIAEQKGVEREVAFHGERLAQYKREVGNCQTAARQHQVEADTLTREAGEKMNEAKNLEDRARRLEEEADRLE